MTGRCRRGAATGLQNQLFGFESRIGLHLAGVGQWLGHHVRNVAIVQVRVLSPALHRGVVLVIQLAFEADVPRSIRGALSVTGS